MTRDSTLGDSGSRPSLGLGTAASVSLLGGFSVMALELAAVRLLAPHFGDSAYVWTNVIGVLLASMAVGAHLGGRLSRGDAAKTLGLLLFLAGGLTTLAPLLASSIGPALLPDELALDGAGAVLTRGSLAATLLLFAPPILLAATASPILVSLLARSGSDVGRSAGFVGAWSTLGSLLGTFGATHLLVPQLGSRMTVWIAAAALVLAGALVGRFRRAGLAAALPLVLGIFIQGPLRAPGPQEELLSENESELQYLQVVQDQNLGRRVLRINEGLDSFQSVEVDPQSWTQGLYYDFHALAGFIRHGATSGPALDVLSLGSAAGTFERIYAHAFADARMTSVEIDPEIVALGRTFFGAYPEAEQTEGGDVVHAGLDARVFVERTGARFDVALIDAYERQVYLPAHVVSQEFFERLSERLVDGGVVSVNVGGRTFDDPVVQAVGRTLRKVFGESHAMRVPRSRNFVLLARQNASFDPSAMATLATQLGGDSARPQALRDAAAWAGVDGAWRKIESEGAVLTDDRPFLDELQDTSFGADSGAKIQVTSVGGSSDSSEAVRAAQAAYTARAFDRVLGAVGSSVRPTAELRRWAGDARWERGDLRGARAEYEAGLELATGSADQELLQARITQATSEIERIEATSATAEWSSALAAAIGAALLLLALWLPKRFAAEPSAAPDVGAAQ